MRDTTRDIKKKGSIKNKPYSMIHTSIQQQRLIELPVYGNGSQVFQFRNYFNFIIILSGQIPIATRILKDYDVRACKQEQAKVNI